MIPLGRTLKMEKTDAHKAGEGKTAESFQVFNCTVDDVVEKWKLAGAAEVKIRSGR